MGARVLERVDHQARGRLEHLRQLALVDLTFALVDEGQQRLERRRADALEGVGGIRRVAHARLEEVEEVLRAGGERHPVGLELDALGAEGEVGEPLVAPEAGERGVVRHAAVQRELGRYSIGVLRGGRGAGAGGCARAFGRHVGFQWGGEFFAAGRLYY